MNKLEKKRKRKRNNITSSLLLLPIGCSLSDSHRPLSLYLTLLGVLAVCLLQSGHWYLELVWLPVEVNTAHPHTQP